MPEAAKVEDACAMREESQDFGREDGSSECSWAVKNSEEEEERIPPAPEIPSGVLVSVIVRVTYAPLGVSWLSVRERM